MHCKQMCRSGVSIISEELVPFASWSERIYDHHHETGVKSTEIGKCTHILLGQEDTNTRVTVEHTDDTLNHLARYHSLRDRCHEVLIEFRSDLARSLLSRNGGCYQQAACKFFS